MTQGGRRQQRSVSQGARAVVRLGAIRHNLERIRELARGAKVMAVVKANAYGHGLVPVARQLGAADSLAVARLPEAITLREAGIEQPIVVLQGVFTRDELSRATAERCELVVHCEPQVVMLEAAAAGSTVVWLKVDTGMRRLGFEPAQVAGLRRRLAASSAVTDLRLMTHLANADDRADATTERQLGRFAALLEDFDGEFSVANSAATLGWQDSIRLGRAATASWLRPGLALYGASPFAGTVGADFGLAPAMDFEARLIAVKPIRAGDAVGYGGRWRASQDTVLGIVAAGYGDGYSRHLPSATPLLVGGREARLAGSVSMDSLAVDLGPGAAARPGDVVTLWGEKLPVERIAACAGTIPYTLLAGVSHREAAETLD